MTSTRFHRRTPPQSPARFADHQRAIQQYVARRHLRPLQPLQHEAQRRLADFAAGLGNVERVDVLPFHQLGRFKWERLGMEYQLRDAQPTSHEKVEAVIALFRAAGLKTA